MDYEIEVSVLLYVCTSGRVETFFSGSPFPEPTLLTTNLYPFKLQFLPVQKDGMGKYKCTLCLPS